MDTYGNEERNLRWEYLKWMFYLLVAFLASEVAMLFFLYISSIVESNAIMDTPILILKWRCNWSLMFTVTLLLPIPLMAFFGVKAIIFYIANYKNPKYEQVKIRAHVYGMPITVTELSLVIIMALFWIFIIYAMFTDIAPLQQYQECKEDIAAIDRGNLVSTEVFFSPNSKKAEPAEQEQDHSDPLMRYTVINKRKSDSKTSTWYQIYIPNFLPFDLDQEHLYNDNKGVEWNEEHSTIYLITYTPNRKIVTSVEITHIGID